MPPPVRQPLPDRPGRHRCIRKPVTSPARRRRARPRRTTAGAARASGRDVIDAETRTKHEDWYRKATENRITLNAARQGKFQQKRDALAARIKTREGDYLRFVCDLRVSFTSNSAEQAIRMSKLRIKISGCMRSMTGAEQVCAIRFYLATAARHAIGALDALITALQANPGFSRPDKPGRQPKRRPGWIAA